MEKSFKSLLYPFTKHYRIGSHVLRLTVLRNDQFQLLDPLVLFSEAGRQKVD